MLRQNLYAQLQDLQETILSREKGKRFPDRYESEIQRKLIAGIKNIPTLGIPEIIQMMKEFTTDLVRDRCKITREVTLLVDNYIQKKFQRPTSISLSDEDDMLLPGEEEEITPASVDNSNTNIFSSEMDKNQLGNPENQSFNENEMDKTWIKMLSFSRNPDPSGDNGSIRNEATSSENVDTKTQSDNSNTAEQKTANENSETIKKNIVLRSGARWIGKGLVYDSFRKKKRELTIPEYQELLRKGLTKKDFEGYQPINDSKRL